MRRLSLPLLALAFAGCPSIDTGADGGDTLVVGPAGGIFFRNGAVLDFPRNAVTEDTTIFVTIVDTGVPDVPDRKRISFGYRITPSTLVFGSPIKLTLPVIDDRVPQAVDPATYDSRRKSGSDAYLALPSARTFVVPTTNPPITAVEAQTDRLGLFWLTSPAQPNVARLEVTPAEATLAVGSTQQFTARVVDPTGSSIDAVVTWSVVPPRVASIDANGLLTARGPGTAVVTARAGNQSATATVYVPGTAVGPRSFVHDNPFPTGNDLHGGTFAPGGLGTVFCGANGTVLARDGAGAWSRLVSSPGVVLKAVGGDSATNAVAVGSLGTSGVLVEFHGASAPSTRVLTTSVPQALWYDGTHGMAVGTGNDVLIRRNGVWELEYSPSFETLLAVVGDGAGSFITVGSRGSIYQWDPALLVWNSLYQTQLSVLLTAAAFTDSSGLDAWAVGGSKLWHFTGAGWTAENLPAAPSLAAANALGLIDGRVVIAGEATTGGGLMLSWALPSGADGGTSATWASQLMRGPQVARGIFSTGATGTQGFVVGDLGAAWEWNHGTQLFDEISHGFYGNVADVVVLAGDVLAAVNECTTSSCLARRGAVMHQSAGAWVPLGPQNPFGSPVLALAASGPADVIASTESGLFRWDGAQWSSMAITGGQSGLIYDLRFCGSTLWGVGQGGGSYRGPSTAFANAGVIANTDLYSVWCPTANEVWTSGDGLLAVRVGSAPWVGRDSQTVRHSFWRAGWSPGGGEAWTFGAASYGVYWDTTQLNAVQSLGGILPETVTAMWGSSVDNLYAVGLASFPLTFGFALRFDGVNWTLVDSGSQRKVTAIDGNSPTSVWVGTEGGGLLRAVAP